MRTILTTTILLVCIVSAKADYTYTIDSGYSAGLTLHDYESLLMTGGGLHDLNLDDYSQANIQGTAPLVKGSGGIWQLLIADYTQLNFSGGEVYEFDMTAASRAVFSGGRIDNIRSTQSAWKYAGDPLELVPDPHIEIVCRDDHYWDETTNILTGTWFDDSTFDIRLVDVAGYSPTIDNIFFTPEPASLLLISIGGLFLRRRKYYL